jgi:PhzF family phenazine biosynthesis protein
MRLCRAGDRPIQSTAPGLARVRLARWTNLSETTFVLPPTAPAADYRLRIFARGDELPFAGYATPGSARAWLDNGGTPQHADRVSISTPPTEE